MSQRPPSTPTGLRWWANFSDLAVKHNKAVVVVTHDLRLREFADQVYTIVDGQMAKEERPLGTPA